MSDGTTLLFALPGPRVLDVAMGSDGGRVVLIEGAEAEGGARSPVPTNELNSFGLCRPLPQTSGGPSTGRTPYRRLISRSTPGSGGP